MALGSWQLALGSWLLATNFWPQPANSKYMRASYGDCPRPSYTRLVRHPEPLCPPEWLCPSESLRHSETLCPPVVASTRAIVPFPALASLRVVVPFLVVASFRPVVPFRVVVSSRMAVPSERLCHASGCVIPSVAERSRGTCSSLASPTAPRNC